MRSRVSGLVRLSASRKRVIARLAIVAALAGLVGAQSVGATTSPTSGPLTPSLARHLSQNANQHVIVILKSQPAAAHVGSAAAGAASRAIAGAQAPLMRELRAVHATHVKSFTLVDAFAATVSKAEVARLKANRAVAEVIPDVTIHGAAPARTPTTASHKLKSHQATTLTPNVIPGACSARQAAARPRGPVLDQHRLGRPAASRPRASLGITGAGVKVAWIADGIDPNNINFIRPNGTSAFIDYQDFTGDGPGQPTERRRGVPRRQLDRRPGPARLRRQRLQRPARPDRLQHPHRGRGPRREPRRPQRVRHVRGHHRVELPRRRSTTRSQTDHVNVINESFGSNPFPDVTALDATKQFDDAAVAAGVDGQRLQRRRRLTNTIGSPATDPKRHRRRRLDRLPLLRADQLRRRALLRDHAAG